MVLVIFAVLEVSFLALTTVVKLPRKFLTLTSRARPPNGGRNEANSDIDTGYTNVVAVALAKTAANYFVIFISM